MSLPSPPESSSSELLTELQSVGMRLGDSADGAPGRRGGAGPSDHTAVSFDGRTIMVPVHTRGAQRSPYIAIRGVDGRTQLLKDGRVLASVDFPRQPRFYRLQTFDGIPYSHIAQLHSANVLATTVLQTCVRYGNRKTACQFCAIGESLKAGRTINRKTPEQLAEVARAAWLLDGIEHMVITTGTPNFSDRGAEILCESAFAVRAAVEGLPIQAQCEPPDDDRWFERLKSAGVDSLGMHLEAVAPAVRARIMPGKADVTLERYFSAFGAAVRVFGWGQVSTYILAGLGDTRAEILAACEKLIAVGVYPFVVPFVPITGTPLENHPAPDREFMRDLLIPLAGLLAHAGMRSADIKAGCARCGACSTLSAYEN